MAEKDAELLNTIYREIADKLGLDTAMNIYQMFKGQQIIIQEYDGTNIRALAVKYNYSEKTVRRIIRDSVEE